MDIKLFKVIGAYQVISDLYMQKLNGALAFKVLELMKELERHMENFNASRNKILKDNGVEPNTKIEDKELLEKLNLELNTVSNVDVKVNVRKLTMNDLEKVEISAQNLVHIDWLIDNGDNS